jgi:hypothetical protein
MQQVRMNVGIFCITTRRHTPEVATISNIPTAHNLMHLYLGRDCSVGTTTRYGLHGLGIESWLRRNFPIRPGWTWGPTNLLQNG